MKSVGFVNDLAHLGAVKSVLTWSKDGFKCGVCSGVARDDSSTVKIHWQFIYCQT